MSGARRNPLSGQGARLHEEDSGLNGVQPTIILRAEASRRRVRMRFAVREKLVRGDADPLPVRVEDGGPAQAYVSD